LYGTRMGIFRLPGNLVELEIDVLRRDWRYVKREWDRPLNSEVEEKVPGFGWIKPGF